LLLPPPSSVPAGDNPYLSLGGLNAVGDILGRAMQDGEPTNAMRSAGLTSEVTFARDQNSAAPIMLLTVAAASPETAKGDAGIFLNQVPSTLQAVQAHANVPGSAYVSSTVIVKPDEVTVSGKSQLRSMMVAGVFGLVLTLLLTGVVDRFLRERGKGQTPASSRGRPRPTVRRRPATTSTSPSPSEGSAPGGRRPSMAQHSRSVETELEHERTENPLAGSTR
jgi:hypothetical protein